MGGNDHIGRNDKSSTSAWSEFASYIKSIKKEPLQKFDLDAYLAKGCFIF